MSIAKMKKLRLVGMSYEKDAILNALHKTNAAEIKCQEATDQTTSFEVGVEGLSSCIASVEAALTALITERERFEKDRGLSSEAEPETFDVSYTEFVSVQTRRVEAEGVIAEISRLTDRRNVLRGELQKAQRELAVARIYAALELPFSYYKDSAHTHTRMGLIAVQAKTQLCAELDKIDLCAYEEIFAGEQVALIISCHKEVAAIVNGLLSTCGFSDCPFVGEYSGRQNAEEKTAAVENILSEITLLEEGIYALHENVRLLKIYYDYLCFEAEKERVGEKLRRTQTTLLLEAYVPEIAVEMVSSALSEASSAIYFAFTDPTEEEQPPTLLQNNPVVECFEGITNTFAPPNYREFDPNLIMGIFYSIFMGFIIADAGYGLTMLLGGGILWWRGLKRPSGMSRLAGAFALGGIFAIIWGLLFNSVFGFTVFDKAFMPNAQNDMWLLVGIKVPAILVVCMEIGIIHLMVGYVCKAVQEWRRGNFWDGIFDGIVWALFSVGVALAIVGFVEESALPQLITVGGITAGGSLLLAMLTAGRHVKGFGKITKGFGAAYGVINYASDILSYARLYGLMLSGAVVAQIIAGACADFFVSGNVALIVLAVVLLVVGNGFNLVMNLLGAYIHDARLQYVEFYGKFFEGEGELFRPLGSENRYVYVVRGDTNS